MKLNKNIYSKLSEEDYCGIIFVSLFIYFFFLESINNSIIGGNKNYIYFIQYPTLILIIIYFNICFINNKAKINFSRFKEYLYGTFTTILIVYLIIDIFFCVFLKLLALDSKEQHLSYEITSFQKPFSGKNDGSSKLNFILNSNNETIKVWNKIDTFFDKNPNDYKLIITARKTAWDYYILDNWWVEKKSDSIN